MTSLTYGEDEVTDATLPRKPSSEYLKYPYPKPTQVDEERILRRSSELSLRNSAKFLRNFGRRRPLFCEGIYFWSRVRAQRNGPSDCLLKTQVSAKSLR